MRISNGRALRHPKPGERMDVSVGRNGSQINFKLYRIKFALAHGYLPPSVDHRDRVPGHDRLGNLRPATPTEQLWNRGRFKTKASGLPKGVYRCRNRFEAQAKVNKRNVSLGVFDTPEEAEAAYRAHCVETRGEFA